MDKIEIGFTKKEIENLSNEQVRQLNSTILNSNHYWKHEEAKAIFLIRVASVSVATARSNIRR